MARKNPDLVRERVNYTHAEGVKHWDRTLVPLIAIYGRLVTHSAVHSSSPGWISALAGRHCCLLGIWALVVNRFFSAVVRIQTERGHRVVDTGPYRFVRHPAYAGGILTWLATPILLGTFWALIPGALISAGIVLRTALEDRTLQAELPGYKEFARKTRYRLVPGVW